MTHRGKNDDAGELVRLGAGGFSSWLHAAEASLRPNSGGAHVPCGACRGCCRSSMFIHIQPDEKQTLLRIPRALLFPAPGLPKGHVLLGYNDRGECPMLANGECSIYEDRPRTCRDYDCRVFAATGIPVDRECQPEIARRVRQWVFTYENEESRQQHSVVQQTARFLDANRDLFPPEILPRYPVQLAILAIEIHRLFAELAAPAGNDAPVPTDAAIVQAILAALDQAEEESSPAKGARRGIRSNGFVRQRRADGEAPSPPST